MTQSVLVTGGAGYVGAGLLRALLAEGFHVTCVDRLSFGGESLLDIWHNPLFQFYRADINDYVRMAEILNLREYFAVIHLAAIVGDPACARNPEVTLRTNWHAAKNLIDTAKARGISRFVFASTCSNYGKMPDANVFAVETSPLAPVSLYAELKVKTERYLLGEIEPDDTFTPTALRFSTVYGVSPRMRFDLTVNEFTKELSLGRSLMVFGEQFWRPYCHVRDFSRAFIAVLKAPRDKVAREVFNVGDTRENYTKRMLVDELLKLFPKAKIEYRHKDEDPRDYRVNSDKIKSVLGFEISVTVPEGMREIAEIVEAGIVSAPDDQRYYNIPYSRGN